MGNSFRSMKAMETGFSESLFLFQKFFPFSFSITLCPFGVGFCERSIGEYTHRIGISTGRVDFCVSCDAHRFG
jgi:hypothetical protein